jgi:hypothetical protein
MDSNIIILFFTIIFFILVILTCNTCSKKLNMCDQNKKSTFVSAPKQTIVRTKIVENNDVISKQDTELKDIVDQSFDIIF